LPLRDIDAHIRAPAMVAVAGRELATLPAIDQFLYVCIHGSRHSWFRLKWIADVGALLHRLSAGELDAIARRASALGIERSLREAILLGHELLAARVPDALLAQARADRGANRRAVAARRLMAVFGRDGDPFASFGLTTRLLIEEYRIRSDWRYRRALLGRHALSYLYPLARPLLRAAQRLRSLQ
jgi:hypothetical protein